MTVRAFLALDVGDAARARFVAVAERLRASPRAPHARWASAESMHLTLKFLGDTEEERARALADSVLPLVAGAAAPTMHALGVGAFPRTREARVVIVRLRDESGALDALVAEIESRAEALGYPRETRAFKAHVTLARTRAPTDARRWLDEVAPPEGEDLGTCAATALTLYESADGKYVPLARATYGA